MIPNDSPLWPILRVAVGVTATIAAVSKGYGEGWVTRSDLPVVLFVGACLSFGELTPVLVRLVKSFGGGGK